MEKYLKYAVAPAVSMLIAGTALYVDFRAGEVATEVVQNEAPFLRYELLLEEIMRQVQENTRLILGLLSQARVPMLW